EVSNLVQLVVNVARVDLLGVAAELSLADVSGDERVEDRLGRAHPGLHREVDPLRPLAVEQAPRVADDQTPPRVELRDGIVACFRDRLRALADHLSALEQRADPW